ncbi:hypothetical protein DH2020_046858 [Rehmannia glutinosa]|uniref:Uncharacterized protein n=1 Tax=Rehmannia glutinosa TaxID=99300 RepID=A0ABR0UBP5_REHGL
MDSYQKLFDVSSGTIEGNFLFVRNEKSEEVRNDVLLKVEQNSLESLVVIDTIQRLGLDYLFQDEIESILQHHFWQQKSAIYNDDLYKASLCFRLLRQQGYQVHADDIFGEFMDEDGGFKFKDGANYSDTKGVLALYEASHLSMEGEEILNEAAICSYQYLNDKLTCFDHEDQVKMVKHCLLYPQHKSLAHFMAKDFIQSLNGQYGWEILLQELAELEFASLESLHKDEILQVVKWWKGLGISKQLKSSRDQPLKWHMWSMATLCDPRWSKHRTLLTKPISLVYAVDDIFDLYGTLEQLTLFTEAINQWDISAAEMLPGYMKTCFMAIYDTTDEITRMVSQEHGWNPAEFLKKEWRSLLNAFLMEAKWFTSGELPKAEEYLKNGVISSGVVMVLAHLFFLINGTALTNETQVLLDDSQGITYSVAKILRLLDDLGSAQDEQQEGYDGSYVECYMEEHDVHSLESAHKHVMAMVSDTWENLNNHCLSSTSPFPSSFRNACLNAARMVPTMYSYDKNHRLPVLEHHIKSMLQDTTFKKSILG